MYYEGRIREMRFWRIKEMEVKTWLRIDYSRRVWW